MTVHFIFGLTFFRILNFSFIPIFIFCKLLLCCSYITFCSCFMTAMILYPSEYIDHSSFGVNDALFSFASFWHGISCNPDWPHPHYFSLGWPWTPSLSASTSPLLESQVCTGTPGLSQTVFADGFLKCYWEWLISSAWPRRRLCLSWSLCFSLSSLLVAPALCFCLLVFFAVVVGPFCLLYTLYLSHSR